MASASAVTHSTTQPANAQAAGSAEAAAQSGSAGSSFEQALFDLLQAGLVDQEGLEQALEGLDLPSSGEKLPSLDVLAQLLEGEGDPEQLKEMYDLLQTRSVEGLSEGELSDQLVIDEAALKELLASVKELREAVRKGELSPEDAYQQFAATLESYGYAVPVEDVSELELKTKGESVGSDLMQLLVQAMKNQRLEQRAEQDASSLVDNDDLALKLASAEIDLSTETPAKVERPEPVVEVETEVEVEVETESKAAKQSLAGSTETEGEAEEIVASRADQPAEVRNTDGETDNVEQKPAVATQNAPINEPQAQAQVSAQSQQPPQPVTANQSVADSQRTLTGAEVRAEARAAAETVAQSSSNSQANTGDSGAQQDRDLNRAQQFREAMQSLRADAGKETADTNRSSILSQSFVLPGQTQAEPAARLNPVMSGFQQLQQAYTTSMSGQVTLNAGAQFGAQNWTSNISQRVSWMMSQKVGHAEIRLDPPDLGSLNIRLTVQNDQATVQFVSPNAQVRDALEQQMPRLREMLEESGIQLEQGDVSEHTDSRGQGGGGDTSFGGGMAETGDEDIVAPNLAAQGGNLSLVDYYA